MYRAVLQRVFQNHQVTFGTLTLPWVDVHCCTLELPWRDNQSNISCIPALVYPLKPVVSSSFGEILWVQKVPDRDLIRVHAGNKTKHTHGCIITGLSTGRVKNEPFIFNSRDALRLIVSHIQAVYLENESCELEVRDV